MNNFTQKTRLKELMLIERQIDKTISDIGRLSSYNQSTEITCNIKLEKMNFLRSLVEKKTKLLDRVENTVSQWYKEL